MEALELLAKKKNRRLHLKILLVSFFVVCASLYSLYTIGKNLATSHRDQLQDYVYNLSNIAYPNIQFDRWATKAISPFSGTFRADRYKTIAGIEVPYESFEGAYSIGQHTIDLAREEVVDAFGYYSTYGLRQKYPQFFSVDAEMAEQMPPHQDLAYTSQMQGQLVEVAITFDQGYTFSEIQDKIPEALSINWYWIGPLSNYDMWAGPADLYGLKSYQRVWFNKEKMMGFQTEYQQFLTYLQSEDLQSYYKEEGIDQEIKQFIAENQDGSKTRFAGIILTGKAEDFSQLEDKDWIYASSIGATVQNQPYYQLDEE
ncbi:TPA: anti sigma factor C-terminal domain-containing protein [Streptococcus suis]|nr:anti sigma factor C-terminal domain-containing protein [Streptococcus suis]